MIKRMIAVCLGAVLLCSCSAWQDKYVFYPEKKVEKTPKAEGSKFEEVTLKTSDGVKIVGWWVPTENARATVIFCHGNAGNISHRLETLKMLRKLRLNTFIFDYRGYGKSEGKPSEKGTYRDAEAAWDYVTKTRKIAPERVILHGRSLGGAIAAHLASTHKPRALILESTFTSVGDMAGEVSSLLPVAAVGGPKYATLKLMPKIHVPVLVVHSPDDRTIPFAHGERLYKAANKPKTFLRIRGDHNDGWLKSGEVYTDGVDRFVTDAPGNTDGR